MHQCIIGHTHLRLSFVKHVRGGRLQVCLLCLGCVINVDRVGGILRQVNIVDGASFFFQLKIKTRSVATLQSFGTCLSPDLACFLLL